MKKATGSVCISLLTLFSLLLFNSCSKSNDTAPGFDMTYRQDFSIPVGLGTDVVHHFYFRDMASQYDQYLTEHKKKDSDISRIIPSQFALSGIFGDANLNFVDEVSMRIYSESDPNDHIEIAYRYPVPLEPGNTLAIIPNLPDIKRFMTKTRFSIDLALRLHRITPVETPVRLDLQFRAVLQ